MDKTRLEVTTLSDLDELAIQQIVDYLDMSDIHNLCSSSRSLYHLLHNIYIISLTFPLHNNYMVKDEPEKPVLAILANGTTDQDCQFSTNKQIAKINIGKLKLLRLLCPNEEDEDCINSCSNYHQRILFNLYYRHWNKRTSFNLQRLSITVSEKVRRLYQAMSAMPTLTEVDLHMPIKLQEHVALIRNVCAQPSIRKVSVTILLESDHLEDLSLGLKSHTLKELTLKGAAGLSITNMDLPNLKKFTFLPHIPEVNIFKVGGFNMRFYLMHRQCPSLQFYNDVEITDITKENYKDWAIKITERM